MDLNLPQQAVPDRVSITEALAHPERLAMASRKAVIRIYFDEEPAPHVEARAG